MRIKMKLTTIFERVNRTMNQGCNIEDEILLDLANEMISDVSEDRNIPLPGFEVKRTVACSGTSVKMPSNYSQNLFFAATEGKKVWVCSSMAILLRRYPAENTNPVNGDIYVCVSGKKLEIRPSFTGNIDLHFYSSPSDMSSTDSPLPFGSEVSDGLQKALLHSYCCKELYNDIEDGAEGAQVNTARFEQRYEIAIEKLRRKLKHGQSRPRPVMDEFTSQRI